MSLLYSPKDKYITDTFIYMANNQYHAFSGVASNGKWDWGASGMAIGHAVSTDLIHWQECENALEPTGGANFDGIAVNVGCVIEHNYLYYMFYWTRCSKPNTPYIGLAVSDDLYKWKRVSDEPIIQADARWYETESLPDNHGGCCGCNLRDPFVFKCDEDDLFHMIFASRTTEGPLEGRGCIGHAVSENLINWECLPPLLAPGYYGEMEVPQIFELNGRFYLQFHSNSSLWLSEKGRNELPYYDQIPAHFYWVSDKATGEYNRPDEHVLIGNAPDICNPLVVRVFDDLNGTPSVIHFNMARFAKSDDGEHIPGPLSLPKSITSLENGLLSCGVHPSVEKLKSNILLEKNDIKPNADYLLGIEVPDSFTSEFDFVLKRAGRTGFLLWCDQKMSELSGYELCLNKEVDAVELKRRRDSKVIASRSLKVIPGGASKLKIIVCDNIIDIYLNDCWVMTAPAYEDRGRYLSLFGTAYIEEIKSVKIRSFTL